MADLVGVDQDVGGRVDGQQEVVDLDQQHHPGGVLLQLSVTHHLGVKSDTQITQVICSFGSNDTGVVFSSEWCTIW